MKKLSVFILSLIVCLGLLAACSSGEHNNGIVDPDGNKATITPEATKPATSPTPTATPSPSPSPSPSPTPSPTPIPVFSDIITETEDAGVYNIPHNDEQGYFFNVHTLEDSLLYFSNETVETAPRIVSYNISTGERHEVSFDYIDPYEYNYHIVPDKYIVVSNGKHQLTYFDKNLKELFAFSIPIDSEYPEYSVNNDYTKIYYIKDKTLYECDTKTHEEKELLNDSRFNEAYPIGVTEDGLFLKLYIYTRRTGYYEVYLFDFETKELTINEDYDYYYFFEVSPDKSEVFIGNSTPFIAGLYSTGKDPKESIKLLNSNQPYPDELLKNNIKINSSNEFYNFYIDWERRMIITVYEMPKNSTITEILTCYNIDTGEPVSNCSFFVEAPASQYPIVSFDKDNGYIIISGSKLKEEYCYAWDYVNDDLEDESKAFIRYDYIPKYLDDYRKELEDKYKIYIYLGTEIFATEHDYTLAYSGDFVKSEETLHMLDEVFSTYPEDTFEQLKFNGVKTIGIYLCAGFTKKASYGIENAVALAGIDGYERFLALDITYWGDLRSNIIHEISHWLDKKIEYYGESTGEFDFTEEWAKNNPEDYYYMDDYNKTSPFSRYVYNYTSKKDNYYFIDTYSLTKATEDRARLFESLMRYSGSEYFESEHMRAKLHTYFDYLRKSFDTTNWPEETIWEYKLKMIDRLYSGDENVTIEDIYPEYFNGDTEYSMTDDGFGYLDAYSNIAG